MKIPSHSFKSLNLFGNNLPPQLSAPKKFNGWLGSGLADLLGREIYEGHIVQFNDSSKCTITFTDGMFFCEGHGALGLYHDSIEIVGHVAEDQL